MYVHKNICTKMFLAVLLVKAKIGNIPNACEQEDKRHVSTQLNVVQ